MICMDALESVSHICGGGRMVYNLFQSILALEGFDVASEASPDNSIIYAMDFDFRQPNLKNILTFLPENIGRAARSTKISPSLVDHIEATLNSIKALSLSDPKIDSGPSKMKELPPAPVEEVGVRYLLPETGERVEHTLMWMDAEVPVAPVSSGVADTDWQV